MLVNVRRCQHQPLLSPGSLLHWARLSHHSGWSWALKDMNKNCLPSVGHPSFLFFYFYFFLNSSSVHSLNMFWNGLKNVLVIILHIFFNCGIHQALQMTFLQMSRACSIIQVKETWLAGSIRLLRACNVTH